MMASFNREVSVSLSHAIDLNLKHAMKKHNRDIPRLGIQIGQPQKSTMYRWLGDEKLPLSHILAFEFACDAHFITQFLAHSHNKMLVDIPSGRKAAHRSLNDLSSYTHLVMKMLFDFTEGKQEASDVINALTMLIADLAYQRGKVEKANKWRQQPELLGE